MANSALLCAIRAIYASDVFFSALLSPSARKQHFTRKEPALAFLFIRVSFHGGHDGHCERRVIGSTDKGLDRGIVSTRWS